MIYEVDFQNGDVKDYVAKIISENILTQVDSEGYYLTMTKWIFYYNRDDAVAIPKSGMYIVTNQFQKNMRNTTVGWKLFVKWMDDFKSLIAQNYIKEAHPANLVDFSKARGITNEPAFSWQFPYNMRKQYFILYKVKDRIRKTTHKYGIEIPTNIDQ